jgi:hypothetical protein
MTHGQHWLVMLGLALLAWLVVWEAWRGVSCGW